jgi:hypothetical protein
MAFRLVSVGLLAALAIALAPQGSAQQQPGPDGRDSRILMATPVSGPMPPPVIDGRLDDPIWQTADVAEVFIQLEPYPGAPATERTEARVAFDHRAIYVAMRMYDSDAAAIRAELVRRDEGSGSSDWARVMIDSYHDRRTAFQFATTPRGSRMDVLHLADTQTDANWDAVWEVATSVDNEGWTAEFRIPLSQLRFSGGAGSWGINFGREIARRSEVSYWAPIPPNAGRMVSLFGRLEGMEEVRSPRRLEVLPYVVGRLEREPGDPSNSLWQKNSPGGTLGADLKLGLTSDLTLTATFNPDFGQVEADPSVVNLSTFETFFPEKRPFFTEGTEIFRFRILPEGHLFYSRRIGRPPQGRASSPGGFVDAPATTRILGAAKISGKTRSGWSVGLMDAVTAEEEARVVDPEGLPSAQTVEPATNYLVARVLRDFAQGRSGLGIMGTATNRRLGSAPRVQFLPGAAYVGGANGWHRFGANRYEVNGWVLGSSVRGSEAAIWRLQRSAAHLFQRPDAGHLRPDSTLTSLNGWAGEAALEKIGGGHWTWNMTFGARSPGVDLNDTGFISYTDIWFGSLLAAYREFRPGSLFRDWRLQGQLVRVHDFGGTLLRPSFHITGNARLLSFWGGTFTVDHWRRHVWPWELRGGPGLVRPARTDFDASLTSDSRKSWSAAVTLRGTDEHGTTGRSLEIEPSLSLRPSSRTSLSLAPSWSRRRQPAQYVASPATQAGPEYVVGHLRQRTAAFTLRLSHAFSPALSLDLYGQPFLSSGLYREFRTVQDPRGRSFQNRFALLGPEELRFDPHAGRYVVDRPGTASDFTFRNPDFNVREINTNAVLRWEYRPGSTLFLVWSHARENGVRSGPLRLWNDLDRLLTAEATHVFLLKVSYWMDR